MTVIRRGERAPDLMLPDTRGVPFVLRECLNEGPVLLVFFTVSCPACRTLLGCLERMQTRYASPAGLAEEAFRLVAIGVDPVEPTTDLAADLELSFTVAVESPERDTIRAYGVSAVPTAVLVETDGRVAFRSVGFSRVDFDEIGRRWAATSEIEPYAVLDPGDPIPQTISATPLGPLP